MGSHGSALVLSAGGTFGAYQAGAWQSLSKRFSPDVVIGASIGAVNAWAIAGGCSPEELAEHWRVFGPAHRHRYRWPRSLLEGCADAAPLHEWIRQWHTRFRPRIEIGVVVTDLTRLTPVLVTGPKITWEHLAASCAVFGIFPQLRIEGRVYSDGGMLNALPLWAAERMGAEDVVGIHALPFGFPWLPVRIALRGLRRMTRCPRGAPASCVVQPSRPLGGWRDLLSANAGQIGRWIEQGREDAGKANILPQKCSERI